MLACVAETMPRHLTLPRFELHGVVEGACDARHASRLTALDPFRRDESTMTVT
jgi:hypothetical protein